MPRDSRPLTANGASLATLLHLDDGRPRVLRLLVELNTELTGSDVSWHTRNRLSHQLISKLVDTGASPPSLPSCFVP